MKPILHFFAFMRKKYHETGVFISNFFSFIFNLLSKHLKFNFRMSQKISNFKSRI